MYETFLFRIAIFKILLYLNYLLPVLRARPSPNFAPEKKGGEIIFFIITFCLQLGCRELFRAGPLGMNNFVFREAEMLLPAGFVCF